MERGKQSYTYTQMTLAVREEIIVRLPREIHIPVELIFRAMTSPERSSSSASQFFRP